MRLLVSVVLSAAALAAQHFEAPAAESGWSRTLRAYGLLPVGKALPQVLVLDSQAKLDPQLLESRVEDGLYLILRGHTAISRHFGVGLGTSSVEVRQLRDISRPELPLLWEKSETVTVASLSPAWTVYAQERWQKAPLLAGRRIGKGAVLWTATSIGPLGYEKFPYLPQALHRLGLRAPAEARRLTAFFDASHRLRVDIPYLVERWSKAGIAAIHVTSWQFDGASAERAAWLSRLIDACHHEGIAVYAWIELPHVSDLFWEQHPECREKTAAGADAQLDWRRLINLVNAKCSGAAEQSILALLRSYDWDGANLGELYFESLEGIENPSRFTPFSADAVEYFNTKLDFDVKQLLAPGADAAARQRFLEQRVSLAAELQSHWLSRLASIRKERPDFDLMLTHIDDRLDTRMREALGADSARLLAATEGQDITFLIEDPATVWHLGPERYRTIRERYEGLTPDPGRLAIDLNIVERYQDVYPTKQQTGAELLQLVHQAAQNFEQVALYFEASLLPEDLPFLASAAARLESWQRDDAKLRVVLQSAAWLPAHTALAVEGRAWPLRRPGQILLPAGRHEIRPTTTPSALEIEPRNLELMSLEAAGDDWVLGYTARTQAWLFSPRPFQAQFSGGTTKAAVRDGQGRWRIVLPRGKKQSVLLRGSPLLNEASVNSEGAAR